MFSKVKNWLTGAQRQVVDGGSGGPDVGADMVFCCSIFVSALLMNVLSCKGEDLITSQLTGLLTPLLPLSKMSCTVS